jgi:phage shock protein PspC (stress-responsive transcriptional regulator)
MNTPPDSGHDHDDQNPSNQNPSNQNPSNQNPSNQNPSNPVGGEPPAWGSPGGSEHQHHHDQHEHREQPSGPRAASGAAFFDGVRRLGVVRPDEGRRVAGVCAGLARRWGMSPGLVRVLFVLVSLFLGLGLALYGVLWLLLPHPDGRIHAEQVLRGVVTGGFVGAVTMIVLSAPLGLSWAGGPEPWAHHHGPGLFPLLLIGVVIWLLVRRGRHTPQS